MSEWSTTLREFNRKLARANRIDNDTQLAPVLAEVVALHTRLLWLEVNGYAPDEHYDD